MIKEANFKISWWSNTQLQNTQEIKGTQSSFWTKMPPTLIEFDHINSVLIFSIATAYNRRSRIPLLPWTRTIRWPWATMWRNTTLAWPLHHSMPHRIRHGPLRAIMVTHWLRGRTLAPPMSLLLLLMSLLLLLMSLLLLLLLSLHHSLLSLKMVAIVHIGRRLLPQEGRLLCTRHWNILDRVISTPIIVHLKQQ